MITCVSISNFYRKSLDNGINRVDSANQKTSADHN